MLSSSANNSPSTVLYVPCGSLEDAKNLSRQLLERGLAFCCNVVPEVFSSYVWKGEMHEATESILWVKTHTPEEAKAFLWENHPYEEPVIWTTCFLQNFPGR